MAQGIGLAHDAGNLFAALNLYCDLLSAPGVLRPEHSHYITELRQLTERSNRLVQKLLTTPQQPQPGAPLLVEAAQQAPEAPNAAHILREIEPLLVAIVGRSATVSVKTPRALPTPPLPAETLERIIVNLVRNAAQAIEFAPLRCIGGYIRVSLATLAGHLRLTVEDNGPGMPVTTVASFLSPAPLPQNARRGLGHRIVHELVTGSGGTLSFKVRPGRGTTVSIQWPVPAIAKPGPSGTASASTRGNRRLGVVTC
ncbi:sensor histidine kinase [Granulicella sp. 5B5]|uniref:sensor histidine kinase n=1 Tax=Granulicella sp. 5B5 TaxID=1617967 RepID=UPI0015F3A557|nr:sensor histidine kinase [Granulicella sp. 5B5]